MSDKSQSPDAEPEASQLAIERFERLIGALDPDHKDWPMLFRTLQALPPYLADWLDSHPETNWLNFAIKAMGKKSPQAYCSDKDLYPTRGYYTEHPVFAALAVQPHGGVSPELIRNLQSGLLVGAALREDEVVSGAYISPLRPAGQSVRDAAEKGLSQKLGSDISDAVSIADLCEKVLEWVAIPEVWRPDDPRMELTVLDQKVLRGLRAFLRDIVENRGLRSRQAVGRTVVKKTRVELADGSERSGPAITGEQYSEEAQRERRDEGLSSVPEISTRSTLADYPASRNSDYSASRLTESQANCRIILRARGWKSSQQWTPNRTEILHPPSLAALFATSPKWDHKSFVRWEMILLMLFSGCTVKDVIHCRVWPTLADVPARPEGLGIIGDSGTLVMPVLETPNSWGPEKAFPSFFKDPNHRVHEFFRPVSTRLLLPLPRYLPAANRLAERARLLSTSRLYPRLKDDDIEPTVEALKKHLSKVNRLHGTNLTLNRISLHVANTAYSLDGDMAEALLLSYRHREANDHRLYYYTPTHAHLVEQYDRIWRTAATDQHGGRSSVPEFNDIAPLYIGSAAVPLTEKIRSTVASLADHVGKVLGARGRRSRETWRQVHNSITVYVIRQIQWMTGIRAIRDPIEVKNYDPSTGFLRINDKDSDDKYGARVVWLLPQTQRQVRYYYEHVERASQALGLDWEILVYRFLEDDGTCPEVSNQALARYTPCEYLYSANAHRHYLRTRMRELGVDAVYVDAWNGHGGTGREPYARHSSLTPYRMTEVVRPALEKIWEELGWVELPRSE